MIRDTVAIRVNMTHDMALEHRGHSDKQPEDFEDQNGRQCASTYDKGEVAGV